MRKIIHIDMDCFYAAIEERDDPSLRGKPVGVGGSSRRGVLTTANYVAREFGCRSAMPVFKALELCPHLVLVPVRFDVYRAESAHIRRIFARFTESIEPLSLDEAYLDVGHLRTPGAAIAREIRSQIREETGLTASAGIAPNKLLAKIASDWNKPDGQFEVVPEKVQEFMDPLPVSRLWGVGKKSTAALAARGVETCGQLRAWDKLTLAREFGRWGEELWFQCRGIDERPVQVEHIRKSSSVENTFQENIRHLPGLLPPMKAMLAELQEDLSHHHADRMIRSLVVKLKFADFERTTAERAGRMFDETVYRELVEEAWSRGKNRAVRLLGVGVRFVDPAEDGQMDLFG